MNYSQAKALDEVASRAIKTECIVIGAGHCGLAMSQCLSSLNIEHAILERGEVANSWKQERWESLRLLTPNWLTGLPGKAYSGDEPDGFMDMPELIEFLEQYAREISAPINENTSVISVNKKGDYFYVTTNRGVWQCRSVVIASGACNNAKIPAISKSVPDSLEMLTPLQYQNPSQLKDGGVLVVGASATGLQLAKEIHQSGKTVYLSVGEHVRLPRYYRGKDIQFWMNKTGLLDEKYNDIDDLNRGRSLPSPQLSGSDLNETLDLNSLAERGVNIRGRLAGFKDDCVQFSGALTNTCQLADLKMNRLLDSIDEWILQNSDELKDVLVEPAMRFLKTGVSESPQNNLDMKKENVSTILWATGFTPDYSWLNLPVFDHKGRIRHDGGIVDYPGVYVMGLPLLRRRKSSFIHGAADDAADLSLHLKDFLQADQIQSNGEWTRAA